MNHLSGTNYSSHGASIDLGSAVQGEFEDAMQETCFSEMKSRFQDARTGACVDDITLLRFLAADQFSVDKGLVRLLNTLKWRESFGCERLLTHPPPNVELYQQLRMRHFVGVDRENRPILMERLTEFCSNQPGLGRPFSADEWLRLYTWDLERHFPEMRRSAEACGRPVRHFIYVGDASGFKAHHLRTLPLLKHLAGGVEAHFPEMAKHIIIINAPAVADLAYKIAKRFLDPNTARKVEICTGAAGLKRLLELAGHSAIPREFGGTSDYVLPNTVPWEIAIQRAASSASASPGAAQAPRREAARRECSEDSWICCAVRPLNKAEPDRALRPPGSELADSLCTAVPRILAGGRAATRRERLCKESHTQGWLHRPALALLIVALALLWTLPNAAKTDEVFVAPALAPPSYPPSLPD